MKTIATHPEPMQTSVFTEPCLASKFRHRTVMNRRTRDGFTLTELLVVIAIIAVLAVVGFSLAKSMGDKAKVANCVSNLRQIDAALKSCATEKNGLYPGIPSGNWPEGGCGYAGGTGRNAPSGPRLLVDEGYAADLSVFFCPAEKKPLGSTDIKQAWGEPVRGGDTYVGYCFFAGMKTLPGASQKTSEQIARRMTDASNTILVTDVCNGEPLAGAEWNHSRSKPSGGNILFNDGSVQWRNAGEMSERYKLAGRSYYW